MSSKLVKHLEFIEAVIARLSSNSFLIKGWGLTLASLLFTLAVGNSNNDYSIITYPVILVFWLLDGYFLSRERRFRFLYESVRQKEETEVDFSMETVEPAAWRETWPGALCSCTLLLFYGAVMLAAVLIMFSLEAKNG